METGHRVWLDNESGNDARAHESFPDGKAVALILDEDAAHRQQDVRGRADNLRIELFGIAPISPG
jgi:hypothetical protein